MNRDKELEVGLRCENNGNSVKRGREIKNEQLCHKAVLTENIFMVSEVLFSMAHKTYLKNQCSYWMGSRKRGIPSTFIFTSLSSYDTCQFQLSHLRSLITT